MGARVTDGLARGNRRQAQAERRAEIVRHIREAERDARLNRRPRHARGKRNGCTDFEPKATQTWHGLRGQHWRCRFDYPRRYRRRRWCWRDRRLWRIGIRVDRVWRREHERRKHGGNLRSLPTIATRIGVGARATVDRNAVAVTGVRRAELQRVVGLRAERHRHQQQGKGHGKAAVNRGETPLACHRRILHLQATKCLRPGPRGPPTGFALISERIAEELEKESLVVTLNQQTVQKRSLIAGYNADLAKLVIKGTQAQVNRHVELSQAAQALNLKIQGYGNQRRTFLTMQDEVRNMRATKAPEMLRELQARHPGSGLNAAQWDEFLLVYKGDVDKALSGYIVWVDQEIAKINGVPPPPGDPNVPLIADGEDLATVKLATIKAEMARLEQLISADTIIRNQYTALFSRIAQENNALKILEVRLTDAQGAAAPGASGTANSGTASPGDKSWRSSNWV